MSKIRTAMPETDLKARELDINDNIAYILHGSTIKGAYRRKNGGRELILAGLTDTGAPFIITIRPQPSVTEDHCILLAVAECNGSRIERYVLELKKDIDRAEA